MLWANFLYFKFLDNTPAIIWIRFFPKFWQIVILWKYRRNINDFREIVLHYCSNILQKCSMSPNSPFIFRKRFHCFDMTYSDVTSSRKKTNKTYLGQHGINNSFRTTRGIFSRRIFEHQTFDLPFDAKRFAAKNDDNETLNWLYSVDLGARFQCLFDC